ncbi:group 2 family protein [Chrysochromulina tobinii]|uniref:Group 2 family protein n=1 Tax=Chrysochromulina tobinii TaxID=1460289 RepID=A0A0M0JN71_9EUKA|nr:group 2 family protein [Chrysochromulina tobinii]|eukprot:KOO27772.1 group 2 family protein [Chrysochromulina sp. CCMP291]
MRLWTDKANRAFLAHHYPEHLPMYDGYSLNIKRVDAIRYFLLFHYGGVYMDADFACVRSLDTMPIRRQPGVATLILQRKKAIDEQAVSNAWMSAPPRHPFFA